MSNHTFQIIGDVYDNLVTTNLNENQYSSIGQVNREVLSRIDPEVNFSLYDNLNGTSWGKDGKVDLVFVIYRNSTSLMSDYTGIALLEMSSSYTTNEGVTIQNNWNIGGGVQMRGGFNGRDYTTYIAAHELGHYLFGGNHIDFISNLGLMTGKPYWNDDRGMCAWERMHLGWLTPLSVNSDVSITMSDYMTLGDVIKIPLGTNTNEYFLIENRRHSSPHDASKDTGFYIYHVTKNSWVPTIDVECADGNWNFTINTSTQTVTRTTQNFDSNEDEMNFYQNIGGIAYRCIQPYYLQDDAGGDLEDAFDLNFNNVFSPKSNPRSINGESLNFTIQVTGENTLTFYFTNPYAGAPAKIQNCRFSYSNPDHPTLMWDLNSETDISSYRIYRNYNNEGWSYAGTVNHPTNTFIDYLVDYTKPIWEKSVKYYVVAIDNSNLSSVPSNQVETLGLMIPRKIISSIGSANDNSLAESNLNFNLENNFPNPFNPETNISFSLDKRSFVTLKVYDSLGREIKELVNDYKEKGNYSIRFDGSNLSSGLYLYKLTSGKNTAIKKMILIK